MKGLLDAVAFLTVLPVNRSHEWKDATILAWFPLVGLLLGGLWAGFDLLTGRVFPAGIQAALDVLFMVVLTGGLHLDGLADTADGLFSHQGLEDSLRIMKDSRIGTWGVLALMSILGVKTLGLSQPLMGMRRTLMLLIPAYGRLAMLIGIWAMPYGRGEEGIAHPLFRNQRKALWMPGVGLVAMASGLLGLRGALVLCGSFIGAVCIVILYYKHRLGCVTGDMLGALGEVVEAVLLTVFLAV